jgi:hypothetical protein
MRLVYLTANAAWVFIFGDSLCSMDGQNFFRTRREAVLAAGARGLNVSRSGAVSVKPAPTFA